jgi:xylan 1,4-beta-xylosidase
MTSMRSRPIPLPLLPTLIAGSLIAVAARAEGPAPRVIDVDLAGQAGPTSTAWRRCVGAGRAAEGLRAEWQRQLRLVHEESGFEYIRFHGLLGEEMGVYSEDKKGAALHSFRYVDELYDGIRAIGMRPFVELGFMPPALASGKETIFWWRGNVTLPKSWERWDALITDLVRHWVSRYGAEEVRRWYFEIWNEPDLGGFFTVPDESKRQDLYFDLYRRTAHAIKAVDPALRVGGPATSGGRWVDETIAFAHSTGTPLDFLSFHHYATKEGALDELGQRHLLLVDDLGTIGGMIQDRRRRVEASPLAGREIHMTEWSTSYSPRDPVHDSYVSAPFILENVRAAGDGAQSLSYWVFTDIFEEASPPMTPFHGGFGLLNLQGIRKPAHFAFAFLNRLGPTVLATNDPRSLAATDGRSIQLLLWDLTHPTRRADGTTVSNHEFFVKDHPSRPLPAVTARLKGLAAGDYDLQVFRVGYRANDAYTVYLVDLGRPDRLSRAQEAWLNHLASGAPETSVRVSVGADGRLEQKLILRTNDCVLLTLTPLR